ncbi:MAG TPA: Fe-S protein assembly co-chaperone HscB [Candidatus Acidoferrales bacterium]|nr:Fe-S protein assembly co-chaperone HscB [Candidatus Acidoferrales bacterium]
MADMEKQSASNVALPVEERPTEHQCWSCGDMRATKFCNSCGKVQPPMPVDFFSFFGLRRKLNFDVKELEREFYRQSRKLHPDVNARRSDHEQEWSLQLTSQLNDAYRTLRDPVARTEYLLKLEGRELEEQSKSATDAARSSGQQKKQIVPPDLLEEVFELNMLLEEARANRKMGEHDTDLEEQLIETKTNLHERMDALMNELKDAWKQWDALIDRGLIGHTDRERVLGKMVDVLNRRTYIRNLVRDVNEVLEG